MAPRKGRCPVNVTFTTVLQAGEGPANEKAGVIRSETELRKTVQHLASTLQSSVNFEKEQLIFLALGRRPSQGHEVEIYAISHPNDRGNGLPSLTAALYRERVSPIPVIEECIPSFPIHVVKTKKLDDDILFSKRERPKKPPRVIVTRDECAVGDGMGPPT